MTDERMIEELARLDDVWRDDIPIMETRYGGKPAQIGVRSSKLSELPDYLNDMNATRRILCGLNHEDKEWFIYCLCELLPGVEHRVPNLTYKDVVAIAEATPRQIAQSILKAAGKWEDSE